jgi:hypothetical protein
LAHPAPDFEVFVRAVHRRFVLVRALERAALGALVGCVAGALFLPLMWWREQPAFPVVATLLALGALVGLLAGIVRRPSALAAAMEADRQLRLHDLMSTAISMGSMATDGWSRTVLAVADARCREHAPSQVVLRRYGSRAWGGIGLAASLVLTVSALLSPPATNPVVASRRAGGSEQNVGPGAERRTGAAGSALKASRHISVAVEPGRESRSLESPENDASTRSESDGPASTKTTAESGPISRSTGPEGQGGGAGRTGDRRNPPQSVSVSPYLSNASREPEAGNAVGGGGAESSSGAPGADGDSPAASATSARRDPAGRAAPWDSESWPADARSAQEAVEAGRVPDDYRDLVRGYFDR